MGGYGKNQIRNIRKSSKSPDYGMASERLLQALSRYIFMTFFFMLFGLISHDQWGTRGFPFPWLMRGGFVDTYRLFPSLFIMVMIVIVTDCTARIIRKIREPEVRNGYNSNPYITMTSDTVYSENSGDQDNLAGEINTDSLIGAENRMLNSKGRKNFTTIRPFSGNRRERNGKPGNNLTRIICLIGIIIYILIQIFGFILD